MEILAEILSSRTRAEIFRILFGIGSPELHLREIQRQSGMAVATISQEIEKLCRLALVTRRQDGNRVYFIANSGHPLHSTIRSLVLKTSGLADLLKHSLNHELIDFAFVFGSVAAGKESADSDIDLFVVGGIGLRELSGLLKEPVSIVGREISPQLMSVKEFRDRLRKDDHFVTRVIQSPRIMIIGDQHEFDQLGR